MHFTYAAKGRGLFNTINPAPRRPASAPAVSGRPGERGGVTSPGRTRTRARAALRGGSAGKRDAAGLLLLLGVSVSQRHLPRPRRRISEAPRTTKSVPVSGHRGRRVQRSRNQRSAPGRVGRRSPGRRGRAVPSCVAGSWHVLSGDSSTRVSPRERGWDSSDWAAPFSFPPRFFTTWQEFIHPRLCTRVTSEAFSVTSGKCVLFSRQGWDSSCKLP